MSNNFENGGNPFNQNFQQGISTLNFQNPNYFNQGQQGQQDNFQNNQVFGYQPNYMPNFMPYNFSDMNRFINNQMQRSDFQQSNNQMQTQGRKELPWVTVNSIEDINQIRCNKGEMVWFMFNDVTVFGIKTISEDKSGNGINNAGLVDVRFFNFSEINIEEVKKMLQLNFDNTENKTENNDNPIEENNLYEKMLGVLQNLENRLTKIENDKENKNNVESIKRTTTTATKRKPTTRSGSGTNGTDFSEDG